MSRFHNRNFELLEPYDAKVSCTVLRGESIRKDADLLDNPPGQHFKQFISFGTHSYGFHVRNHSSQGIWYEKSMV